MASVLNVALPFFAVLFAGYASLRFHLLDKASILGLNAFVFYVALPALLLMKVSTAPVESLFNWRFFVVFYGVSLFLYAVTVATSLFVGGDLASSSLRAFAVVFTNSGYMGIPLLLAAMGPDAALASVLALLLDNILTTPLTVALLETARGGGGVQAVMRTFANLLRNPMILGTFGGFLIAISGLSLPTPAINFLNMLGVAASPCALFALGASLVGAPVGSSRAEVALISLGRLVVHPILVWYGAFYLLPLPSPLAEAAVITAALPTAATVFVVAQRYEIFVLRSSTIVLVTHVISVVTLTGLLVYFR